MREAAEMSQDMPSDRIEQAAMAHGVVKAPDAASAVPKGRNCHSVRVSPSVQQYTLTA